MHITAIATAVCATVTQLPIIAMDIAKSVFQLHTIGADGREVHLKLPRGKLMEFFTCQQRCLVVMEACGGAHYWARQLQQLGHEVRLLPAQHVKSCVVGDKTDARDARGIYLAAHQPHIHPVPVKTVWQQECLGLLGERSALLDARIAACNALRSRLMEFGIVFAKDWRAMLRSLPLALADAQERGLISSITVETARWQAQNIQRLQEGIEHFERLIAEQVRTNPLMRALVEIHGIGSLTAVMLVASEPDMSRFASARQFVSYLGLAPRQKGTGGKVRQMGISKRGNRYLRCLLMHCARSLMQSKRGASNDWIQALLARRPYNVAVAAVASKLARTIWAVLVRGKPFDAAKWNPSAA